MLDTPLADRLKSKSVKDSIVSSIARDFTLTPLVPGTVGLFLSTLLRESARLISLASATTETEGGEPRTVSQKESWFVKPSASESGGTDVSGEKTGIIFNEL